MTELDAITGISFRGKVAQLMSNLDDLVGVGCTTLTPGDITGDKGVDGMDGRSFVAADVGRKHGIWLTTFPSSSTLSSEW